MRTAEPRLSPPSVASAPGAEADKLLQRFGLLDGVNRAELLQMALRMMDRQERAKLPPREQEARQVIDRLDRCLELLATEGGGSDIKTALWRAMVQDYRARLVALGIDYFGHAGAGNRANLRRAA